MVYFHWKTNNCFVQQPYDTGFKISEAWVGVFGLGFLDLDGMDRLMQEVATHIAEKVHLDCHVGDMEVLYPHTEHWR